MAGLIVIVSRDCAAGRAMFLHRLLIEVNLQLLRCAKFGVGAIEDWDDEDGEGCDEHSAERGDGHRDEDVGAAAFGGEHGE